jgi:hypothetical protein
MFGTFIRLGKILQAQESKLQILASARSFSFHKASMMGSALPTTTTTTTYSMGTRRLFPCGYNVWGMRLTTHHHLKLKS